MSEYISEMRKLVGTRPLLLCGPAVIILDRDNRVLLHHRTDNDAWGLPGGMIELGERLEDAAVREVQEEVGLRCHSLEFFGVYSGPELHYHHPNGDEVHNVTVAYICRDFSGTIRVDETEGTEAAFFAIEEMPAAISPPIRVVIDDLRRRWEEIVAGG